MTWSSPLDGPAVVPPHRPFNRFEGSDIISTRNQHDGYFEPSNIDPALFSESSGMTIDGFFNMDAHGFITTGYNLQQVAAPKATGTLPSQLISPCPNYDTLSYRPVLPTSPQITVDHDRPPSIPFSPPPLLSRHASSPGTLAPATPQLSASFPSVIPLASPTPLDLPTHPSIPQVVLKPRNFCCHFCTMSKEDAKSLNRHEMETHFKPEAGQTMRGWFTCRCGKSFCYYRKSNYDRHIAKCKPRKWNSLVFTCQCLLQVSSRDLHAAHYKDCRLGRRPVGRPTNTPSGR